jgi:hypothetical protein
LKRIPSDLQKAISLRLSPGQYHHLDELKTIELSLYGSFGLEKFYDELQKFIGENIRVSEGSPLSLADFRSIDEFVRKYFTDKLPEAQTWIVRAFVIGKLIETGERIGPRRLIDVEKLPATVKQAASDFKLSLRETKALEWSASHGAEHLMNATNDTINRVQRVLFDNIKNRKGVRELRRALEDEFFNDEKELNRNWKRVAISETNAAFNQGYLAQLKQGDWVVGFSLPDACDFCATYIDGKIYPVIESGNKSLDYSGLDESSPEYKRLAWLWENTVWQNKDNFGRSFSRRKRMVTEDGNIEDNLLERKHHELWRVCIPAHPFCRCRYIRIDVERQYLDKNGEMKMRVMDEAAWKKWHEEAVIPVMEGLSRHEVR